MNNKKPILIGLLLLLLYLLFGKKAASAAPMPKKETGLFEKTIEQSKEIFKGGGGIFSGGGSSGSWLKPEPIPDSQPSSMASILPAVISDGSLFAKPVSPVALVPVTSPTAMNNPAPRARSFEVAEVVVPVTKVKGSGCVGCNKSANTFNK